MTQALLSDKPLAPPLTSHRFTQLYEAPKAMMTSMLSSLPRSLTSVRTSQQRGKHLPALKAQRSTLWLTLLVTLLSALKVPQPSLAQPSQNTPESTPQAPQTPQAQAPQAQPLEPSSSAQASSGEEQKTRLTEDKREALLSGEGLRYWLPTELWLQLKVARAKVKASRELSPSYQERYERFQEALVSRAQWDTTPPTLPPSPTVEQLRAQLKSIEDAKRSLTNRKNQGLPDLLAELDLYLTQLIDQERASLSPLEGYLNAERQLLIEGPPLEETSEPALDDERQALLQRYQVMVQTRLAELQAWQTQLAELTSTLKREGSSYEADLKALSELSERVAERLSHELNRAELTASLSGLSPETLLGLKATRSAEVRQHRLALEERRTQLARLTARYEEEHRARLANLTPPTLAPHPSEDEEETLANAAQLRYALQTASQVFAFHQQRAKLLTSALEAHTLYLKELQEALSSLEEGVQLTLALDVIEERAQRLAQPVFWSADELVAHSAERPTALSLNTLLSERLTWRERLSELTREGDRWRATLKEDQSALERLKGELEGEGGLREQLKKEEVWVHFLKEIDSYDTPKLISAYQRDVSALKAQEQALGELEKRYQELSAALAQASKKRARLSDPLLRQYPASPEAFLAWSEPLLKVAKVEQTSTASDEAPPIEPPRDGLRRERAIDPEPLPEDVGALTESLRAKIPPRVTYYQERATLTEQLKALLQERAEVIKAKSAALLKRADVARHVWRSAALLRRRALRGEAPKEVLTDELSQHRSLSWVTSLKAEGTRQLEEQHEREASWLLTEPAYEPIKVTLSEWSLLLSQITDLIEQRDQLSEELKRELAPRDQASKSKLELDQQAHELKRRISDDQRWYEGVWELIHSRDTKSLDELLEGLYVELMKLERRQSIIERQLKLTHNLSERVEAQRPLLKRFHDAMEGAVERLARRLEAERLSVLSQLDPQQALSEVSAFNATSELKVSAERGAPLEGEARVQVVMELKRTWSLLQAYQLTLSRIKDALSPQGMLERSVGQVKDSSARLQSEHEQLTRPIHRLLGARARGVVRGERLDALGEIDRIRDERFKTKLKAAARILLSFCLIPLIALLVIRFVGHFGERIFSYVLREQTGRAQTERERQEREERSDTLFQVFRAAMNLLIWTLTGIYLLKAIQVDVTPIIASAGVLGLALAFGAQELVRDFFAGFFILLENQYNIGDIVRIQGTFGRIERITLRLTILRDEEGVVHFIPNGQVGMVSNCTREWSQARVEIGASYNAPPKQVIECLRDIGDQLCADPVHGGYLLLCEVLGLERFDDSAVIYKVRLRVTAGQQWQVARLYRQRVMETFAERGIEIPFPQMVVHYSPPELSGLEGLEGLEGLKPKKS